MGFYKRFLKFIVYFLNALRNYFTEKPKCFGPNLYLLHVTYGILYLVIMIRILKAVSCACVTITHISVEQG